MAARWPQRRRLPYGQATPASSASASWSPGQRDSGGWTRYGT